MVTLTAYYDGLDFVPTEKKEFQIGQQAIIVINELEKAQDHNACRGIASKYANTSLITKEAEIISNTFSGI